jgi:capsular exopolysaccharide synthesis family protein
VSTSVLIDPSGSNRVLGNSKYVEGGVGLIEMEKNLYNEIGIIKSFSLISQTVKDLDFDITYHMTEWLKTKEHYGYFPFEVSLNRTEAQLYDIPFELEILSSEKYRLSINADEFEVSNPSNGSTREVNQELDFLGEFSFGDKVEHHYFNFQIQKPDYKVKYSDFIGRNLSFIVHDIDDVTNGHLSYLEVDNIDIQASIFKIVSYGPLVDKEVKFLKKLIENYIQNKLKSRNEIASSKESFIRDQLNKVTDSLLKVELNLEVFKKDKNAVNLGATAINALDQTQNLQIEQAKKEIDIKYYNSLIESVESNLGNEDFVLPTTMGIDDPLINENILELKRLYSEKSKKKFYLTSNNQEMDILKNQIRESKESLLNNLKSANNSTKFALRGLRGQLSSFNGLISSLPTREKQLLGIQRQSTLYENLFNYLSQELAKTGIARAESTSDTRVLDEARMVGDTPVAPQKKLLLVLAITLGALIPFAWMVWFSPNDIIENIGQIAANTDIPVIASIAHHNTESDNSDSDILLGKVKESVKDLGTNIKFLSLFSSLRKRDSETENAESDVSLWNVKESFRDLSANIKFVRPEKRCCVLGITSIMPQEGKTFCAINLGITFAEAGKKTLIIDTDLRNPSLVDGIRKIEGKGLSNYLQGDISTLSDIVYSHDKLNKLQFIPTSVVEGNIHGLLSGDKMKSLIREFKESYDYIILDTPAVGLVSDFILFNDEIDVNLYVVRRKVAKIAFLRDLEKLVPRGEKKKRRIIFNDALGKDYKYGYRQKYGVNNETQLVNETLSV